MTKLLVLDVDSTLIQQEVIELIASRCGVQKEVESITKRAMAGELDFEKSLRERVGLLAGVSDSVFPEILEEITLTDGAPELIESVHSIGGRVGAVSGGFQEILEPLANRLRLDFFQANTLEKRDGSLTGGLVGKIIDRKAKAEALVDWAQISELELAQTIAVGDGANDIDMLKLSGLAVGFRPKQALREVSDLVIEENSLRSLIPIVLGSG